MKKISLVLFSLLLVCSSFCEARGGFSSGGGRGGFSSAGRTPSSISSTRPSSIRSTTTTSTVTRSYGGANITSTNHYYGSFGTGYIYNNGFLTGMIIGNMMHPTGTVVYAGGGAYSNNALLYPNGQVVSSTGQVVGNYNGSVFTPIENGPIVARTVPLDAVQQTMVDHTPEIILLTGLAIFITIVLFIAIVL